MMRRMANLLKGACVAGFPTMTPSEELASDFAPIYAEVLRQSSRATSPEPWDRFVERKDLWQLPSDDQATIEALQGKFRQEDLIRSGVAVLGSKGELSLNQIFWELPSWIVPVRSKLRGTILDLLTAQGTVTGRLPLHTSMLDGRIAERAADRSFVFSAFSMSDLLSLRAINLPTGLALGLECFTRRSLSEFRDTFRVSSSGLPSIALRLILVAWTPSRLSRDRPSALDSVISNMVNTASCHGMPLDHVDVWQPSMAEIRSIASCLEIGNRKTVVEAVLNSIHQSAKPLVPSKELQHSGGRLLETGMRLKEVLLRDSRLNQRRKKWREHQQAVDDELVQPLFELASTLPDVERRGLVMAIARVHQVLHPNVTVHLARLEHEVTQRGLRSDGTALDIKALMKGFDTLYKLTKEYD